MAGFNCGLFLGVLSEAATWQLKVAQGHCIHNNSNTRHIIPRQNIGILFPTMYSGHTIGGNLTPTTRPGSEAIKVPSVLFWTHLTPSVVLAWPSALRVSPWLCGMLTSAAAASLRARWLEGGRRDRTPHLQSVSRVPSLAESHSGSTSGILYLSAPGAAVPLLQMGGAERNQATPLP